jgi:predicted SAM-dependent methyltransferase
MSCTDYYATGEVFDIYRCDDCNFTFTQDVPVESEIGRYYESPDYISHSDTRKGAVNTIYHWVRSLMLRRKASLVESNLSGKRGHLLDIGTGTGYFPYTMHQRGWEVEAVEKNAAAREFALKHFNLHVQEDEVLDTYADESFDTITLWHVMEHLENLDKAWSTFYRLLKKNGILVIAVPNCSSIDATIYNKEWAAYDVPRHLWHFTPDTMKAMGEKYHFKLKDYRPMPFDAFYVSMLTERNMKQPCSFVRGLWNGFRAYLGSIGHKELSSSIIYIFRK